MTQGEQLRVQGFKVQLRVNGRNLKTLDDRAVSATAVLAVAPQVMPETLLGKDPREVVVAETLLPAPEFRFGDFVTDGVQRWKVLQRENNTGNITCRFWLQEVTIQDK